MGPKRGRGAAKKSRRGTGIGQVAERPRSPTPQQAEDEAMLVPEPEQPQPDTLQGIISQSSHQFQQQPPAKSVQTNPTTMQH
ncbi:hypothetical protein DPMN_064446 [Dreissena polymorpha]|uniref:Uncharacterized protein n=1 Tax=Dreissena polymorpha TaxID=45954 RepID=A0A9D4HK39_DREPO|nr:hypothetical protein DPMN_064446 [Dreissena polymorpha]